MSCNLFFVIFRILIYFLKILISIQDFDFKYIQDNGFEMPIVFKSRNGLDMIIPENEVNDVNDIKAAVGSKRVVDVVDVNTQKALTMTMKVILLLYFFNGNGKEPV